MFLAIREMKHAKQKYILIAAIMILISFLVLFVSGLAKGLSSDNASSIQSMTGNYFVIQEDSNNRLNRSMLSQTVVNELLQLTTDIEATPLGVKMTTLSMEDTSLKIDATFFAIDTNSLLVPNIVEGRMINDSSTNEIVVDESIKDEGYKLGDRLKDQYSEQSFEIVGFSEGQSFSHTPVIHINYDQWQALHQPDKEIFFNTIALQTTDLDELVIDVPDIEVVSKEQVLQGIPGYSEEQSSLLMMITFLFVIAALVLAVFFYVITIQKINQFGVLKAIGVKSSYLANNIISQVVIITLISLLISIVLTFGIAEVLPTSMPFYLNTEIVVGCSLLFLVVSILGSLLSLYRVIKVDAIIAIGRVE
ncbi:ABC transporter permease [Cytobacillus sp. Hm23]